MKRNVLVRCPIQIREHFRDQNGGEIWVVVDKLVGTNAVEELHDAHMSLVTEVERVGDISRRISDEDG